MHRFRTDSYSIVITLERHIFSSAAHPQLTVRPKLLRPVSRHASANGKDPQPSLLQQRLRKMVQIEEWVEIDLRFSLTRSHAVVQRNIQSQLRIGKRGHKYGHALLERRFQYTPTLHVLLQIAPNLLVQPPRAHGLFWVPG